MIDVQFTMIACVILIVLVLTGCATPDYVQRRVDSVDFFHCLQENRHDRLWVGCCG